MLRARVPEGSESHLSGNRFAAQWITTCGLHQDTRLADGHL